MWSLIRSSRSSSSWAIHLDQCSSPGSESSWKVSERVCVLRACSPLSKVPFRWGVWSLPYGPDPSRRASRVPQLSGRRQASYDVLINFHLTRFVAFAQPLSTRQTRAEMRAGLRLRLPTAVEASLRQAGKGHGSLPTSDEDFSEVGNNRDGVSPQSVCLIGTAVVSDGNSSDEELQPGFVLPYI